MTPTELATNTPFDKYNWRCSKTVATGAKRTAKTAENGRAVEVVRLDLGNDNSPDKRLHLAQSQTCRDFIAQNCKASILRVFPGQFLGVSVDEVLRAADDGDAAARTAKKLLTRKEYQK